MIPNQKRSASDRIDETTINEVVLRKKTKIASDCANFDQNVWSFEVNGYFVQVKH